MNEENEKKRK